MGIYNVAAYITGYKDRAAVDLCLQGIYRQTHPIKSVYLLDNSPEALSVSRDRISTYWHQPENVGIGEGLKRAIAQALSEDCDFLWTFDQDSIPRPDCLETLLKTYQQLVSQRRPIGIVAPTPIDCLTGEIVMGAVFKRDRFLGCEPSVAGDFYECDAPITSGSLLYLAAARAVGSPRVDLFIDGIDLEYGMRLRQHGYFNIIASAAILDHHFGNPLQIKLFGIENTVLQYSALRHFYICRNHTYLETRYARGLFRLTGSLRRIKYALYEIVKICLYNRENWQNKVRSCLLGTYLGFRGKLGKM
ncbi:putative glycosyltransferase [Rubidibacter lacunae KORDI 51-2]|uniref:Putative glycosyltransferase n=1 Tax=Rubidibacter lacunae KORDI 51-2 TaxID=582515 RepID=U5DP09_9CHRO|nr:glycosyltransferase family 2 protein [Rubidibacter lacunae]ERN42344.1 putative glycosyltransferase [Rubidibacter lacunae KORDI 51-2]